MKRASKATRLSESMHRRLNAYALVASAAGVSCLALSHVCDARIIHKQLNVDLSGNGYFYLNPAKQGVAPLIFLNGFVANTTYWWNTDAFLPNSRLHNRRDTGALLAENGFPADLQEGAVIGGKGVFGSGNHNGYLFTYGPYGGGTYKHHSGNFPFGKRAYLGFKFYSAGKAHFGWVRLRIEINQRISDTVLHEYAYETIPGKSIKAGQTRSAVEEWDEDPGASLTAPIPDKSQPATLGVLAMGAHGLSIWRRESAGSAP